MHDLLGSVFGIFYPLYCGGCNREGEVLCQVCLDSFHIVARETSCPHCGRFMGKEALCGDCLQKKELFEKAFFGYYYEGPLKEALRSFKFQGRIDVGRFLIRTLSEKIIAFAEEFDCMVPVPVTEARLRRRGFNQTFIIGEEIAKLTGNFLNHSALEKIRETEDQAKLSKEERKKNLRNAFRVRDSDSLKNKRVLVIDDLYTTGSTVREVSKTLLTARVHSIIAFALARTP